MTNQPDNRYVHLRKIPMTADAFADNDGLHFILDVGKVDYWPAAEIDRDTDRGNLEITFTLRAKQVKNYDPEATSPAQRAMFRHMVRSKRETVEAFRAMLDMAFAMMGNEELRRGL